MSRPIEEYAAIGDGHTAALIGIDGSLDWLCLPQFDSPACFAALLGDHRHGHWLIGPAGRPPASRRYVDDTAVLETTYTTDSGEVRVTDLMPVGERRADVIRRVEGVRGTVTLRHSWIVRFDYGRIRPWVHRRGGRRPSGDHRHRRAGQADPHRPPAAAPGRRAPRGDLRGGGGRPPRLHADLDPVVPPHPRPRGHRPACLALTLQEQQEWADACEYDGPVAPPGRPQPGHPARADPRRHRRHRRGGHHLAARGLRRGAQLGLPLLLAARRRPDARVAARRRSGRPRPALARLAAARDRRATRRTCR